jgi:hypothetical protein
MDLVEGPAFGFNSKVGQCEIDLFDDTHERWGSYPEPVENRFQAARGLYEFSSVWGDNWLIVFPHWLPVLQCATFAAVPWIRRFSLRTLLIATTLIAVVLGLIVWSAS